MKKYQKYYTIYKIKNNNDLEYIKEYTSIQDIKKDYNLSTKTDMQKYITTTCEEIKEKLQDRFIIIKDIEEY